MKFSSNIQGMLNKVNGILTDLWSDVKYFEGLKEKLDELHEDKVLGKPWKEHLVQLFYEYVSANLEGVQTGTLEVMIGSNPVDAMQDILFRITKRYPGKDSPIFWPTFENQVEKFLDTGLNEKYLRMRDEERTEIKKEAEENAEDQNKGEGDPGLGVSEDRESPDEGI